MSTLVGMGGLMGFGFIIYIDVSIWVCVIFWEVDLEEKSEGREIRSDGKRLRY